MLGPALLIIRLLSVRSIITKESSAIRTAIKEGEDKYRLRNVCKLLYIQMMGYPTVRHWFLY